jgi:hypothetical protein
MVSTPDLASQFYVSLLAAAVATLAHFARKARRDGA